MYKIFFVSHKVLIISAISNGKTNELTIYAILCQNVTIFYRQNQAFFISLLQEKLKARRNTRWNFSTSCLIADDSHVKITWQYVAVFSKDDILYFWDNFHFLKYYPMKVSQNCFYSFNCSNQTLMQASKFPFALGK